MLDRFKDWRGGVITNEAALSKVTELPFLPHGEPPVTLYRTAVLGVGSQMP